MSKRSGFKVLIVASWGYPPQWREARYCMRNVRIGGIVLDNCCIGCSSSLTLYLLLKSHDMVSNTQLLVIGSDTVIKPSGSDIRGSVEKWFNSIKKTLLDTTRCNGLEKKDEWVNDIHVGVVPGIGEYYGYFFRGDIVKMFVEAYRNIVKNIKDFNPSVIALDTTHGLNILTIAVLYATIAASIVYNKSVFIVNSEPYPLGRKTSTCIPSEKPKPVNGVPELYIHDISLLQQVIDFLRALNSMRYLNEKQLNKLLEGLRRQSSSNQEYVEVIDKITCMVEASRTGLLGLIYNNSKLSNGKSIPFTIRNIYDILNRFPKLDYNTPWFKPCIKNREVVYEENISMIPAEYVPILDFLRKYMGEFETLAQSEYLKEFAKHMGKILEKSGYWDRKQIVVEEASDLTEIACKVFRETGKEVIDNRLLEEYWRKSKGFLGDGHSNKIADPRNFAAHAALNFNILNSIRVIEENGECKIVEIIYDYNKLMKTLENLGKSSKLCKCLGSHM